MIISTAVSTTSAVFASSGNGAFCINSGQKQNALITAKNGVTKISALLALITSAAIADSAEPYCKSI
jgi:hypothetical protein